jgi:hypothetical protein
MVMLVTVLTLPAGASEWNRAVCGSVRQFRAVDAQRSSSANSFTVNNSFFFMPRPFFGTAQHGADDIGVR